MVEQTSKTFISYAREDTEFALKLAKDLRDAGADIWVDQLDIRAGERWDRAVQKALKDCPGFLVILSPYSVESENVMDEVGFALKRKKRMLPLLHNECEIPFRLERLQRLDFTGDYASGLRQLLTALGIPAPRRQKVAAPKMNPKDGLEYIWIPPGEFLMGAVPGDDEALDDQKPQHRVKITRGFWLSRGPVTVAAYERFSQDTGSVMPGAP